MFKKYVLTTLTMFAALAGAAGLLASTSSASREAQRTIAVLHGTNGFYDSVESGAKAASTTLGDHLIVETADAPAVQISDIKTLIAQHVDAIAIDPTDHPAALKPVLAQARAAGIATLSFDQVIPGNVWINQVGTTDYTHALADVLAAQMGGKGQYAIVPCRPANPIVQTWLSALESYIPAHYPFMKRVGVIYGDDSGNPQEMAKFEHLVKTHPHLRGLIPLCQTEAYVVPQAIIRAHKVGKVFVAGSLSGDCPPVDPQLAPYVRRGVEEIVCAGDAAKLGYLTVWAADYLAAGHSFAPGSYDAGGPVGKVGYYSANRELRVGPPLTVTKANIEQYVGKSG